MMLENFENGVLSLKMHQMFNLKTQLPTTGHFGFLFEGNLGRDITRFLINFQFPFSVVFHPYENAKASVFSFRKLCFHDGSVWMVSLTVTFFLQLL